MHTVFTNDLNNGFNIKLSFKNSLKIIIHLTLKFKAPKVKNVLGVSADYFQKLTIQNFQLTKVRFWT